MEEFISAAVNSLADFLKLQKSVSRPASGGEILLSFIYPSNEIFDWIALDNILTTQDPVFIFEKPEEEYKFFGISKTAVIIENGSQRFSSIDKKIKEYKSKCLNNWDSYPRLNIPLFLGAVEFPVDHSDQDWKNFNDSIWIIPEILLFKKRKNAFIIFNSISPSVSITKNLTNQFRKILESIFYLHGEVKPSAAQIRQSSILKIEGNLPKDKKKWKNQIIELVDQISMDNVQKVVLSRKIDLLLSSEIKFSEILKKLAGSFPGCFIFLYRNADAIYFGASPEKLFKFQNTSAEFDIIAGSAPRGEFPDKDAGLEKELLSNKKNLHEHKIVLDYIKDSIKPFTEDLTVFETRVKKYSNIQHLLTKVTAKLKSDSSVLTLAKAIYPTPSICGMPKDEALSFIKKIEGYKRGLYSGVISWISFNAGEFVIAIRSALYHRRKLTIFAGNGIVKDSNADDEWKETELKLNSILSLFGNETKN
jgi:menaquinone-specific isochorismate synthase